MIYIALFIAWFGFSSLAKCQAEIIRIAECLRHIPDPTAQKQQTLLFGEFDQYIFDDSQIVYIRGIGLSGLISKQPQIKLSGDAVQGRDFSLTVNDSHISLTLHSMKRYF